MVEPDFSFNSAENMVKLLCLRDKDSKDLNDMQEQLARQMGKKPKNSWVARSVDIDDVDIKVLWGKKHIKQKRQCLVEQSNV